MKAYLGDSVYANYNGHAIILTTDNGMGPSNTIELDSDVYANLLRYVKRLQEMNQEQSHPLDQ